LTILKQADKTSERFQYKFPILFSPKKEAKHKLTDYKNLEDFCNLDLKNKMVL
jgi:hypothetical protein